jgi:hypothetical protein
VGIVGDELAVGMLDSAVAGIGKVQITCDGNQYLPKAM